MTADCEPAGRLLPYESDHERGVWIICCCPGVLATHVSGQVHMLPVSLSERSAPRLPATPARARTVARSCRASQQRPTSSAACQPRSVSHVRQPGGCRGSWLRSG
jgi:hypothetical protein